MSWDDQQNICAFGRLNTRLHEVNAELKAKSVRTYPGRANWDPTCIKRLTSFCHNKPAAPLAEPSPTEQPPIKPLREQQKIVEDLDEASNELIIADDDTVRFSVGETFVTVDNDDAETMLQAQITEVGAEVSALEKEKKDITSAMAELKEKLYKKFGNNINLEE